MNQLDIQRLTAALVESNCEYRRLCQRPTNVIAMLGRHYVVDVFRRLMTSASQLEFPDRVAFLRFLRDNEALQTSCEAIVLDERFIRLFPDDLVAIARQNMIAAQIKKAA
jgi:hypothetical protein